MDYIELIWNQKQEKKRIESQGIETKIEIDEQSKEIKNIKEFFREIVFNQHYNNLTNKIKLIDNQELEIEEVKSIVNELIEIVNGELEKKAENISE